MVTIVNGTGLESESVGTGARLWQTETANRASSQLGKVSLLDIVTSIFTDKSAYQGVLISHVILTINPRSLNYLFYLDITNDTDGRINLGKFYTNK
jgi:hypothetical protein